MTTSLQKQFQFSAPSIYAHLSLFMNFTIHSIAQNHAQAFRDDSCMNKFKNQLNFIFVFVKKQKKKQNPF